MFNYIKGVIDSVDTSFVVIDNNGIGYNVSVANPYYYKEGETYKIYTYQHQTEYESALYGFKSKDEKELFLKLINVKGLGPKVALPMFASGTMDGIKDAIERENIIYLTKFPKVGDKLARQIILDLKGKLAPSTKVNNNVNDELVNALESLGYKQNDIKKILPNIDASLTIEEQIKQSLKLLLK